MCEHGNRITTEQLSQTWEWCPGGRDLGKTFRTSSGYLALFTFLQESWKKCQTQSSNNPTPGQELLGYCIAPGAMGGTGGGLCDVSGGPKEQKGSSVCRQGKESHSRLSSGSTARFLTPFWIFSRQERVAFKSHGGYGDAELVCGFSFKARAFLHRPFPWQARGGYPLLLQISSQSIPITRCNT